MHVDIAEPSVLRIRAYICTSTHSRTPHTHTRTHTHTHTLSIAYATGFSPVWQGRRHPRRYVWHYLMPRGFSQNDAETNIRLPRVAVYPRSSLRQLRSAAIINADAERRGGRAPGVYTTSDPACIIFWKGRRKKKGQHCPERGSSSVRKD